MPQNVGERFHFVALVAYHALKNRRVILAVHDGGLLLCE
jgi:hypothetical protein